MSPKDKRAVIVGMGIVLAAGVIRATPAAVQHLASLHDRTASELRSVDEARHVLAAEGADRDSLAVRLPRIVALAPRLLAGRTSADAGATLGAVIQGFAARYSLRVTRLAPTTDSTPGGATISWVSANVELEGDVSGLVRLLRDVENGRQYLTIRSITIAAPTPGSSSRIPETLRISLTVAGLYLTQDRT